MIVTITRRKYFYQLRIDPNLYPQNLNEFWKNALIQYDEDERTSLFIRSKLGNAYVAISSSLLSQPLELNDDEFPSKVVAQTLKCELIEWGYLGYTQKATLYKNLFSSSMKFLFHTLLQCMSCKSMSWNELPLNVQYLAYSILTCENYYFSKSLFNDFVSNVKEMNLPKGKPFLMLPGF